MYKNIFIIAILMILSGCDNNNSKNFVISQDNTWIVKERWGAPTSAIDFSGQQSLLEDSRVSHVYKRDRPKLCEEYVLWRVQHDGSCWVSSAITVLLYQMIEGGEDRFDHTIDHFKNIFAQDKGADLPGNKAIARDFFFILELIREKMDHRFSLELRNHSNVYQALDRGFRKLLADYSRQKGALDQKWYSYYQQEAKKIEEPNSWGIASNFQPLWQSVGFKLAEFTSDGSVGEPPNKSYYHLYEYLNKDQEAFFNNHNETNAWIRENLPPIVSFRSQPGFMDVAVLKSVSNKINGR